MKLQRLKLTKHPLLGDLEIRWPSGGDSSGPFPSATSLLLLVGENGAGKTSLLAALCDILSTLYEQAAAPFAYELAYRIGDHAVAVKCPQPGTPYTQLQGIPQDRDLPLPAALHILTSGNEDVWRQPLHARPSQIRLVERAHLPILVLCALLTRAGNAAYAQLMELLGLQALHGFSLTIPKEAGNPWPQALHQAVADLRRHALRHRETSDEVHLYVQPSPELDRDVPPQVLMQALLSVAKPPKAELLLTRVPQDPKITPPLLRFCDLSDGERAFLGVMSTISVTQEQDALLLLDEPEVHYNDAWKARIVDCVHGLADGGRNQILMTSHSSITLTDVPSPLICHLKRVQGGLVAEAPHIKTLGADPADIMLRVFGSDARTGHFAANSIRKCIAERDRDALNRLLANLAPGYWRYRVERALEQEE